MLRNLESVCLVSGVSLSHPPNPHHPPPTTHQTTTYPPPPTHPPPWICSRELFLWIPLICLLCFISWVARFALSQCICVLVSLTIWPSLSLSYDLGPNGEDFQVSKEKMKIKDRLGCRAVFGSSSLRRHGFGVQDLLTVAVLSPFSLL